MALLAVFAGRARAQAAGQPATNVKPRVIRTMTHHQVTSLPRGVTAFRPVVSDSGNRILFGVSPADGHPPGLAVVDFDGGNLVPLDEFNPIGPGDLSADGSRVVYVVNYHEIRIVGGDGRDRRTLLNPDGGVAEVRITADGQHVFFLSPRGFELRNGDNSKSFVRGVYRIDADGKNLHRVIGPEEVARVRGTKPDDVGSPNFRTGYAEGSMDISSDGRQVVFGCYDSAGQFLIGCDGDGGNPRVISERRNTPGVPTQEFLSIALSGDGTTVACQLSYPNELVVASFAGKWEKSLLKEGQGIDKTQPIGFGSSEPIYITADGSRVTYMGRHINSDGSGWFQLLKTHQDDLLRYAEYETPAVDAVGRRFAYWMHNAGPGQVATMELNVPPAGLRGAPRLTEITVDPGAIPREKEGVPASKTSARAAASPVPDHLSCSGFKDGLYDTGLTQNGSVGITDLRDDGKTDAGGDAKAGDGVYTGRWLRAYAQTPSDGSWTLRFEAQVQDGNKLFHGQVVEVGPFPIVDGQPAAGPVTLDGMPPPPPTVNPQPGTTLVGPVSTSGTDTPGNTNTGTTTNPPTGAIDLTGYWKSDQGAIYFVRQVADKVYWYMDGLPGVRNAFSGSITGDTLTGTWADLPGGTAIETGTGTVTFKIESNDKLTKVSSSATPAYGDTTLVRIPKPPGASVGISGVGGGGGTGPAPARAGAGQVVAGVAEAPRRRGTRRPGRRRSSGGPPWRRPSSTPTTAARPSTTSSRGASTLSTARSPTRRPPPPSPPTPSPATTTTSTGGSGTTT